MPVNVGSCTQSASPKSAWYHYRLKFNSYVLNQSDILLQSYLMINKSSEINKPSFVSSFVLLFNHFKKQGKPLRFNEFIGLDPAPVPVATPNIENVLLEAQVWIFLFQDQSVGRSTQHFLLPYKHLNYSHIAISFHGQIVIPEVNVIIHVVQFTFIYIQIKLTETLQTTHLPKPKHRLS